ncbi:hypothetical protein B0J12DRAFT_706060 [Macrophomina phaseolina]|uniref:Uncharacterized protein n=1 Tax=Macrophomina phaseolina TaxID=35725 RepID=A0ABQ8FT22_9PEZI|nr:hypothetical protein B0J12DRAFT_706060 [Macrophomina phaseolina]
MSQTLLLDQLLPADSVTLGRLVLSVRYPEQDFYEANDAPVTCGETAISTQRAERFTHAASTTKGGGAHAFLTSLLSGARNAHDSTHVELSAALCVTRQLADSAAFFRRLVERGDAQAWLERAAGRRQPVFLVTGIKTVTDATVSAEQATRADARADLQLPGTLAAAAATAGGGLPLLAGDALDLKAGASVSRSAEERTAFAAPGERVFAVQYRRIRFRWFHDLQLEQARLEEGVRWKVFLGMRRGEAEGGVVEASTTTVCEDQLTAEGPFQQFVLDNEQFLYPGELGAA